MPSLEKPSRSPGKRLAPGNSGMGKQTNGVRWTPLLNDLLTRSETVLAQAKTHTLKVSGKSEKPVKAVRMVREKSRRFKLGGREKPAWI